LFDEYLQFLLLQNKRPSKPLVPSLEVQAIWFSHMLQSGQYEEFIKQLLEVTRTKPSFPSVPSLLRLDHVLTCLMDIKEYKTKSKEYEQERSSAYKKFDKAKDEPFIALRTLLVKDFTPQMAADDQLWLEEFLKFTQGTDYKSLEFRKKAVLGYQRMLYLKWKDSKRMEEVGFAPCPAIDLIWHTHLIQPESYRKNMLTILGHVPKHKLLEEKDRTLVFFNDRDDEQERMWRDSFQESLFFYGA